jgi:signal transduction histidine kinase
MNHLMLELRTGTTPLQSPRPLALEPIVRRACGTRRHGPSIQLKIAPGVIAMGHEDRLESVIGHLVQNALDATAQGGQVHVQLDSDQEHARIVIADTGIGMSPEFIRKRLFKPFETTKTAGMGIGVYESSQYVAGLGGRMAIDSRLHVGTRVSVLLPLRERGNAAPIPHQEVA